MFKAFTQPILYVSGGISMFSAYCAPSCGFQNVGFYPLGTRGNHVRLVFSVRRRKWSVIFRRVAVGLSTAMNSGDEGDVAGKAVELGDDEPRLGLAAWASAAASWGPLRCDSTSR